IKVAKGFTIRPEVFFYDYGEHEINGVVDPQNGDLGSQTIIGVQFLVAF
ncbi:MAG: hypothetical protein JRJ69_09030, partial [Deltaproteobacteria bacterium]|nr:hypothetical protein [Deltaproteobacteria bacterium]MBW1908215.1 hypothetical protein [Deltaproteobacteria bacterium]MBW1910749.1 hypothetical protein [Deltaproteobacteria bacterium]MBW2034860.1 hypothetical protein [Deltaproteobacteria bacterium]MBW2114991.1 hypothetical protein [Deltaproteobacteria bacterium]